jgi:transposase
MATAYTPRFRTEMLRRMTGPSALSAKALARDSGVAQVTLSKWLREARTVPDTMSAEDNLKGPPRERTLEEKFRLVSEGSNLSGEELGAFLRREGVQEVELRDWKKAMLDGLNGHKSPPAMAPKAAAKRIKELEKELRRKDKALAEAAAIALLKKKAQALGLLEPDEDDDSSGPSGSSS